VRVESLLPVVDMLTGSAKGFSAMGASGSANGLGSGFSGFTVLAIESRLEMEDETEEEEKW